MKKIEKGTLLSIIIISIFLLGVVYFINHLNNYILLKQPREITENTEQYRDVVNSCFNMKVSKEIKINSIISADEGYGVELEGIKDLKTFIYNDLNLMVNEEQLSKITEYLNTELSKKYLSDYISGDIKGNNIPPAIELKGYDYNSVDEGNNAEVIVFYKEDNKLCAYLFMDHAFSNGSGITELFFSKESIDKYIKENSFFGF